MSRIPAQCDVVVVGGGPAGTMAASKLAQEGFEVILLEKTKFPRPNVGESLIPHFWKFTDIIGASKDIEEECFLRKVGGIGFWGDETWHVRFSDFGLTRAALHVERDRFDDILLGVSRRSGVQVFEETVATRIDPEGEVATVDYRTSGDELGTIRAHFVIDASGQAALLARQFGFREFDPDFRFTALWGYYTGGQYLTSNGDSRPFEDRFEEPPVTVQATLGDWGWTWHITMRETISVGLILTPERLKEFKQRAGTKEERFQDFVADSPVTGRLLEDARFVGPLFGIRDYAYLPTRLAVGRCYLAGDAAAFVDPINSAGVPFGMWAGFLSAWAISSSLRRPERSESYRNTYCKLYGDRLELFRMLAMPSDSPGLEDALDKALESVRNAGPVEQKLFLSQAVLANRSQGPKALLERLGLDSEPTVRRVAIGA